MNVEVKEGSLKAGVTITKTLKENPKNPEENPKGNLR